MKKALIIFGFLIGLSNIQLSIAQTADNYVLYRDLDAVRIDYTTQQCTNNADVITEFHFLRLKNKTSNPITVSFKIEYYYNGSCTTCGNSEYQFTFEIPANATITSDCSLESPNARLAIISKYVNRNFGSPLERFELSNISVQ